MVPRVYRTTTQFEPKDNFVMASPLNIHSDHELNGQINVALHCSMILTKGAREALIGSRCVSPNPRHARQPTTPLWHSDLWLPSMNRPIRAAGSTPTFQIFSYKLALIFIQTSPICNRYYNSSCLICHRADAINLCIKCSILFGHLIKNWI